MWRPIGKSLLCVALLGASLLSAGCWNRREMNSLAIAVGMGIDKTGDQFTVSMQVVNPETLNPKTPADYSSIIEYREKQPTIFEALRKMTTSSPRKIYLSHLRILVISEEQAKAGISEVLDFISRDHEARADFDVVLARGTSASDLLNVFTQMDRIPSVKVFDMLKASEKAWASTKAIRLDELLMHLESDSGESAVMTGIQLYGNKDIAQTKENIQRIRLPGVLKVSGLAVLKEDRLVGWLNDKQSAAYNYLTNNVKNTVMHIPCPSGGKLTLEIVEAKSKLKPKAKDGEVSMSILQRIKANVGEVACDVDLTDEQTIKELEKEAERKLGSMLSKTISQVQKKYGADIFGFGKLIHRKYPRIWEQMKDDWGTRFSALPVEIDVKAEIKNLGSVNNSFIKNMKE
ncbi:Ger(x)C family spore germination protein [Paenibacillus sp. LHD-117]|uniref:Ger(x)C family spore germination protein n=1 Tax=Paenibacillus sp. LHD-117 TaxID=3071412 RepID=UPI0027E1C82F|nr:Ger(x)C family spore germination protein [Paenibacillus sp. LHD-117]MDQ6422577.1 Ger(x)C family spore germination protein [Paenibacillus sp. LHD-117]